MLDAAESSSSAAFSVAGKAEERAFDRCDVAVFGGGFGGLYTALALSREARRRPGNGGRVVDVALVDPSDRFVFLPLLYDLTMGTATAGEVCPLYADLLEGTGVRHVRASFEGFVDDSGEGGPTAAWLSTRDRDGGVDVDDDDDSGRRGGGGGHGASLRLSFEACVVSVGATPQSVLASVPGAARYTHPFYAREDAAAARDVLFRMDDKVRQGVTPRVAVVGGGYGGVELAACLARRLPDANVTLVTRGPPMGGTRAEPLVDRALRRLGVAVELGSVKTVEPWNGGDGAESGPSGGTKGRRVRMELSGPDGGISIEPASQGPWDAVFWTAGSGPAYPVPENAAPLALTTSGRLQVDGTLRCSWGPTTANGTAAVGNQGTPLAWALGDCSEIVSPTSRAGADRSAVPRTAQAAMQQAEVVAANVLCTLEGKEERARTFQFQDLGTVLSLGGPNGAYIGPNDDSPLGPLVVPLLDTARAGFDVADRLVSQFLRSPKVDGTGLVGPAVENLGLSLGGYGLGVDPGAAPGTLSGTLSGAARRAIYAIRMPTNRQRAYAVASAALSSAAALAKEAADQVQKRDDQ